MVAKIMVNSLYAYCTASRLTTLVQRQSRHGAIECTLLAERITVSDLKRSVDTLRQQHEQLRSGTFSMAGLDTVGSVRADGKSSGAVSVSGSTKSGRDVEMSSVESQDEEEADSDDQDEESDSSNFSSGEDEEDDDEEGDDNDDGEDDNSDDDDAMEES